jgi:choline transport protein
VFYLATKSQAGTAVLMAMIIYLGMMALFSTLTSVSRLTWAFANDNGLPFSKIFSQVNSTFKIPLYALLLDTTIAVLLLLINIGSTAAFFAIVSLSTFSLYISYIIPLVFFTICKLRGEYIPYGPFKMHKTLGLAVNFLAICWAVFIAIFLPFPSYQPVTAENMNWAGPVMGAVIILAILDYITTGRKRWTAPIDRKDMEEEEEYEGGD